MNQPPLTRPPVRSPALSTAFTSKANSWQFSGTEFSVALRPADEFEAMQNNETIPGTEGKKVRPKTVEGKVSDLSVGQRVRVQYEAGAASRIVVLQVRPPAKGKESEREQAPELKPKRVKEREREREQPAPNAVPTPRKEGGEKDKG